MPYAYQPDMYSVRACGPGSTPLARLLPSPCRHRQAAARSPTGPAVTVPYEAEAHASGRHVGVQRVDGARRARVDLLHLGELEVKVLPLADRHRSILAGGGTGEEAAKRAFTIASCRQTDRQR